MCVFLIAILFVLSHGINIGLPSKHDAWSNILEYTDANTTQQLRLVSRDHKLWIDARFLELSELVRSLSRANYYQTLQHIKVLIHQNKALKLQLRFKPEMYAKLLIPQIINGRIITNNLRVHKIPSESTKFIEHFYDYLTSIKDTQNDASIRIYGKLFGLKLLDSGYKRQLHRIRSANVLRFITKSRNYARLMLFDHGVLDVICDPMFYEPIHMFGEKMRKMLQSYWRFKGNPQWLDDKVRHVIQIRRANKWLWKTAVIHRMEHIWRTHQEILNTTQYKMNVKHMAHLLGWMRNELGFTYRMEHIWRTHQEILNTTQYKMNVKHMAHLLGWMRNELGFTYR
eukprot:764147_1